MVALPSGTVTFLFTDVEGSTAHWERHPDAMRTALETHDAVLQAAMGECGGAIFATGGDGFAVAFGRADAAVTAAIGAQRQLATQRWPGRVALKVRMGLHTGEAHERDGDYFGPAVNRAARVMDAANGSQILLSATTREVVRDALTDASILVDLGAHELRDVVDPVRLYRLEDRSFDRDRRPPRTGSVRAGNLAAATGTLLGRADDIDSVIDDLTGARVVTLTGVGGIGKTQLALEVGRHQQPQRRDGVWFAALDTIDRPELLVRALLGLLGIEPRAERDLDSLIEGLRFRDTLLVLDNCEHLLDAAAEITSAIVAACPNVQVLATSREPLDLVGERTRRVRSLTTEDDGPAVSLFLQRADEAGAPIDAARDAEAITRICRRLDGIPLAIELAAARARSLRPAEIADRLDDMFHMLTGGKRASAERHRTLRATLEWSHDLLRERERAVLARLSIFAATFPLVAAEVIAAGDPVRPDEVLDIVDRLVTRSLLVPVDDGDETRFRLLEPIRQLAAEKLAARNETDGARTAHTDWYLELIVELGERWRGGDDQTSWPVAARELPNLKAAFDDLIERRRIDDAECFAVAGFGVINCQFDNTPLYDWAPRSVSLDTDHIGPDTASACAMAAWGRCQRGDLDQAETWLRRGAAAVEAGSRDDGLVTAAAMFHVWSGGDAAISDGFLQRSLDEALRSHDLHRQVWVLSFSGRPDEAMVAAQRLGNKTLLALAHSGIRSHDEAADWDAAESFWDAAQRSHSFILLNHAAHRLGIAHIRAGSPADGLLLLRSPARDWLLRADRRVWDVLHSIATGLADAGDPVSAARLAGAIQGRDLATPAERRRLRSLMEEALGQNDLTRHETAGHALDAGGAVAEALERIDALTHPTADGPSAGGDAADLTARQHDVAQLVARGLTNKQIAQRLGISRFTAETHVRNILERLGATSRSEIATWVAHRTPQSPQATSGTPSRT